MRLTGTLYDFGDQPLSEHLRDISRELEEQAFLNGEDDRDISRGHRPIYDLAALLAGLAVEAATLTKGMDPPAG